MSNADTNPQPTTLSEGDIAILDFGGQYAHLIANRIRRLGVHAVIERYNTPAENLKKYKGIILSGGPQSVNAEASLLADEKIFELGIPVLGICYGHQLTNKLLGGTITPGVTKEYGKTKLTIDNPDGLFKDLQPTTKDQTSLQNQQPMTLQVWMSHWDEVTDIPVDFEILAHTDNNEFAAVGNLKKHIYGIQFHPEVTHTEQGLKILENFVDITEASKNWDPKFYLKAIKEEVKEQVKKSGRKVFMMVSGGVDSVVAFTLLNQVLGEENVYGLLVDTGFMRKGEIEEVKTALDKLNLHNLHVYDAKEEFYKALDGIYDPEEKRQIIGKKFLEVQAKAVQNLELDPDHWMLGQGTIYPDTIETGGTDHADKIKTHHNRVPEIQEMMEKGLVIEPLKDLYKDEVREMGEQLGLPHHLVWRHPFPGPGLAIRILCTPKQVTEPEVMSSVQMEINEFLKKHDLGGTILPIQSVGVQGDVRTYRHPVAIYPIDQKTWKDHWKKDELEDISTELTNRFDLINRVVFTLSDEPIHDAHLIPDRYLSAERAEYLQEADTIVMNEIDQFDLEEKVIWQCPTVLLPLSLHQQQNEAILIRPVSSIDAMTADAALIPQKNLENIITQLSNLPEKPSAIFYDLTNKPPGTIEWE